MARFAAVLLLALGCGAATADPPVDLRGVYHLAITHQSGSPAAESVADRLAEGLAGSGYLQVRRLPAHEALVPQEPGYASIHVSVTVRVEQNDFYRNRRRGSLSCDFGELDCGRPFSSSAFDGGTLWGTLHLKLLRSGFAPQERTVVDHIDRGPHQDLYARLAARAAAML